MLSFFRKLSIGAKINDGILPDGVMGTAEDLMKAKNQCDLILKDDNELKDSVYGKISIKFHIVISKFPRN